MKQPTQSVFKPKEIVIFGLFGALMIIGKEILAFLPNIEIVSLFIIVLTLAYGLKALIPVYIFVLAEGLLYGFGLWFWSYLYIWAVLVFAVFVLRKYDSLILFAAVSGIYGLLFGTLGAVPQFFISGLGGGVAYIISGISFDITHAVGNIVITLALFVPLKKLIFKLK